MLVAFGIRVSAVHAEESTEPLHRVSSEVCETCHQEIYRQWKGSMHAQSTALTDPIHGAFYNQVVGDPTAEGVVHKQSGKFPVCLQCHAPNAARDKTTKLDAMPAYSEGVNCVACHTLKDYKGIEDASGKTRYGLMAYAVSDVLQGPVGFPRGLDRLVAVDDPFGGAATASAEDQKPNPHLGEPVEMDGKRIPALEMESNPVQLRTSDACMGCHDQRKNPQGVPLCQTGGEFVESGSRVACQTCHMPVAGGFADHSMGGGHHQAMLERSIVFALESEPDGDLIETRVQLRNLQPHAMPTGAPFRNLHLVLTAYDRAGEVVWKNSEGHPAEGDPRAYFAYGLADDEGHPAPPPTATQPGGDTRLEPHEIRELEYEIPTEGVVLVRGELYYSLLWPSLAKKFDHLPQEVTSPVLIAVAENPIQE
ncbi:cytochrome c family protein [Imhoffiella purpurea]|uniref:Cytochrome c-552/4 domain-containing protein n=1 Tax=Imhoffiella purpurea TaxID=1249627 RepID=W9VUU1_9GAMM|nr:cytochrome c family protein [Imhoffiella purpurea]EXJ14155.1 hypothetical protein D779_2826 [Imhoffiella purpurea]